MCIQCDIHIMALNMYEICYHNHDDLRPGLVTDVREHEGKCD